MILLLQWSLGRSCYLLTAERSYFSAFSTDTQTHTLWPVCHPVAQTYFHNICRAKKKHTDETIYLCHFETFCHFLNVCFIYDTLHELICVKYRFTKASHNFKRNEVNENKKNCWTFIENYDIHMSVAVATHVIFTVPLVWAQSHCFVDIFSELSKGILTLKWCAIALADAHRKTRKHNTFRN